MALTVDESRWPIVVIEVHDELTDADVQAFMDGGTMWLGRGVAYATVIVDADAEMPAVGRLEALADWMKANAAALDQHHRCAVYVTESAMVRGVLKAALHFQPLKAQQHVTPDVEEAIEFARRVLGPSA